MENMEAIMSRIAKNELYFNRYIPLTDVIDAIDQVTAEDILQLSAGIFGSRELTIAGLGPLEEAGMDWNS